MAVLGIVLIVIAVLFGLGVAVSSSDSTTLEVFGVNFGVIVPTVFFLGAVAGALLLLGLWLMKKGLGRGYRRHKEVRELRQKVATTPDTGTDPATGTGTHGDRSPVTDEPVDADGQPVGRHAADVPPDVAPVADRPDRDRLADDRHTVADGTETRPR
ncbi:hypothetical protein Kfla_0569 [Kribbella flavida DSM 17836]|uniref:Lipopolysaccharide assembly protein A domain-containing protein n=1 Tax=Kribbella flavida (strain DSM 17836 / JCM 10339 / NBRC 14399) TaxID=479435 RepID=D2PW33_KRIFD|nr:hypothetical protein [Kribbella flavida]ADB29690.1 hypothetical protein Kfla_0569 [Kribbella flavida DSM 17836]